MVVFSLLQAGEQFRERALLDARRDAQEQARRLRVLLDSPDALADAPAERRFAVQSGALVIPQEVGWITERPPLPSDPIAVARIVEAQRAEFSAHDQEAAAHCYDDLLRRPDGVDPSLSLLALL
jgi:hypothetical protein